MKQEYICIESVNWGADIGKSVPGPKINEVVTFDGCSPTSDKYFQFEEYEFINPLFTPPQRIAYNKKFFALLITDAELCKELESINKTVEV